MLTSPGRRFRLRLKTSVTAVLLISVFISSSFLVQSAHAQVDPASVTGKVSLIPNVGSCNPFANTLPNSQRFLVASGYDDLSSSLPWPSEIQASDYNPSGSNVQGTGQLVREAAVYANGGEPMATVIASASVTAGNNGSVYGSAEADLKNWPYLIFDKATGMPLANNQQSIPVDLSYSFSDTPTGVGTGGAFEGGALVMGFVSFGDAQTGFDQGIGEYAFEDSGGSPEGTLSVAYSGNSGPLLLEISLVVDVAAYVSSGDGLPSVNWPSSEAQAVVDPYAYIDPSSPLAGQLQVYVGNTANANPSDPSQWTPSVQTPIDLNDIVPLATPFSNSSESPSTSSTQTATLTPTIGVVSPAHLSFPKAIIVGVGVVLVVVAVVAALMLVRTRKKVSSYSSTLARAIKTLQL